MFKRLLLLLILAVFALPLALAAQDDDDGAMADLPDEVVVEVPGIQPEGIEWDAEGERFLLGSLTQGTIFQVTDDDGTTEAFIEDEDFMATVGIHIDVANNRLLVPSNDPAVFGGATGSSSLLAYDLETGERLFMVDLSALEAPAGARFFGNDVTVDAEGTAYVTNSFAPIIYAVDEDGEASIFIEDALLGAPGFGLNGIDYHPDGYLLAAVAGAGAIFKIPLDDPSALTAVTLEMPIGIDGMVLAANGTTLVAVGRMGEEQTQYAVALTSEDDWASAAVAEQVETGNNATTIAIRGEAAFYINAYLNNPQAEQYEIVNAGFDADLLAGDMMEEDGEMTPEPDDMMDEDEG